MYKRTTINESVQPRFLDIEEFMTYTRVKEINVVYQERSGDCITDPE